MAADSNSTRGSESGRARGGAVISRQVQTLWRAAQAHRLASLPARNLPTLPRRGAASAAAAGNRGVAAKGDRRRLAYDLDIRAVRGWREFDTEDAMRFVNNVKTAMLLGALVGLCMLIGHLLGGPQGMLIGLLFGGLGNIFAFLFSDKIAIASMRGQEVTRRDLPWLYDMIERLAQRAALPMPRLYVCPQAAPNAFATGRSPRHAAVAITQGMLQSFPPQEIEGVMAHELAHVRHRDVLISTVASVLAGMLSYAAYMLMFFGGGRGSRDNPLAGIGALLMVVLAPLAAGLIQMAISRQREFAADNFAGELTGNPLQLAGALQRLQVGNERIPTDTNPAFHNLYIVEPLSGGRGMLSLFATHPPVEQRIAALRAQAGRMGR